jgi:O-antigen/teichoic acid export membrane protein
VSAYSVSRIRVGLLYFAVGKAGSGLAGFALLLLLFRYLPPGDYAVMVAMMAAFEILSLVLNLGVVPATWRYVPEMRSTGSASDVARIVGLSVIFRALPLLLAALAIAAFPGLMSPLFDQSLQDPQAMAFLFAGMLLLEGLCRHFDLILELLLLQRVSQFAIFLRTCARLIGLIFLTHGLTAEINVGLWVALELLVGAIGFLIGLYLIFSLVLKPARGVDRTVGHVAVPRAMRYAGPAYMAQVLGTAQGFDACKLLVAQIATPLVAAGFGFAVSLVSTLQRYLPSYLLVGFVRPLFVHANSSREGGGNTQTMASILVKLNLILLLPALAVAVVSGSPAIVCLSGGRALIDSAVLPMAITVLALQMLHMVIGLLALSVEESVSGLMGTAVGASIFGLVVLFSAGAGVAWLLVIMVACELVWCFFVLRAVHRKGSGLGLQVVDSAKLVGAFALAVAAGYGVLGSVSPASACGCVASITAASALVFGVSIFFLKTFTHDERQIMAKVVPARFLIF